MTSMKCTVPANSVPAAAVIRGGRALFEMIGRKGHVDCFLSGLFNSKGYGEICTWEKDQGLTMVHPTKLKN